jgi:hypothetical protein
LSEVTTEELLKLKSFLKVVLIDLPSPLGLSSAWDWSSLILGRTPDDVRDCELDEDIDIVASRERYGSMNS